MMLSSYCCKRCTGASNWRFQLTNLNILKCCSCAIKLQDVFSERVLCKCSLGVLPSILSTHNKANLMIHPPPPHGSLKFESGSMHRWKLTFPSVTSVISSNSLDSCFWEIGQADINKYIRQRGMLKVLGVHFYELLPAAPKLSELSEHKDGQQSTVRDGLACCYGFILSFITTTNY